MKGFIVYTYVNLFGVRIEEADIAKLRYKNYYYTFTQSLKPSLKNAPAIFCGS